MNYIELSFNISPFKEDIADIIIAELSDINYESFTTDNDILNAYIPKNLFDISLIEKNDIINNFKNTFKIDYSFSELEDKDWNAEWEANFKPLNIDNRVYIRADFHEEKPEYDYDILINPKMSFGTGHHSTTSMMVKHILETDMDGKRVLDMGCGTGILGIFASMKGAADVCGIDIDEWAYKNAVENIELNNIDNLKIYQGDAKLLNNMGKFDIILANINRNILLDDMSHYVDVLNINGEIIMSGFYEKDLKMIKEKAEQLNLVYVSHKEDLNWIAVKFCKK